MAERTSGGVIHSQDLPPTVYDADNTDQLNLSNLGYVTGSPEVGVYFVAPNSGRCLVTVGGGTRDNTGNNRVFLAPQIMADGPDGEELLAPSIGHYGYCAPNTAANYVYGSRTSMVVGFTPGRVYYARVMLAAENTGGNTADVNCREICVEPAS